MAGYVRDREAQDSSTYMGILTDGIEWRSYRTNDDDLEPVASIEISAGRRPETISVGGLEQSSPLNTT